MRRDDALLAVTTLSVSAFLVLAGPAMAIAAADPGGAHGNGGNNGSGKAGANQSGGSRGNSGSGGSAARSNSGGNSAVSGQTNTGNSSNGKGNGKGNGNGRNNFASGPQSNGGSDGPDAAPVRPPNPATPVVVADQYVGRAPAGRSWWSSPGVPPAVELLAPSAPTEEGAADLLSADHSGIPVWAAAEPVALRGDLFGLAGLVLMPLVGLAVGYRQAKAARDVGLTIGP